MRLFAAIVFLLSQLFILISSMVKYKVLRLKDMRSSVEAFDKIKSMFFSVGTFRYSSLITPTWTQPVKVLKSSELDVMMAMTKALVKHPYPWDNLADSFYKNLSKNGFERMHDPQRPPPYSWIPILSLHRHLLCKQKLFEAQAGSLENSVSTAEYNFSALKVIRQILGRARCGSADVGLMGLSISNTPPQSKSAKKLSFFSITPPPTCTSSGKPDPTCASSRAFYIEFISKKLPSHPHGDLVTAEVIFQVSNLLCAGYFADLSSHVARNHLLNATAEIALGREAAALGVTVEEAKQILSMPGMQQYSIFARIQSMIHVRSNKHNHSDVTNCDALAIENHSQQIKNSSKSPSRSLPQASATRLMNPLSIPSPPVSPLRAIRPANSLSVTSPQTLSNSVRGLDGGSRMMEGVRNRVPSPCGAHSPWKNNTVRAVENSQQAWSSAADEEQVALLAGVSIGIPGKYVGMLGVCGKNSSSLLHDGSSPCSSNAALVSEGVLWAAQKETEKELLSALSKLKRGATTPSGGFPHSANNNFTSSSVNSFVVTSPSFASLDGGFSSCTSSEHISRPYDRRLSHSNNNSTNDIFNNNNSCFTSADRNKNELITDFSSLSSTMLDNTTKIRVSHKIGENESHSTTPSAAQSSSDSSAAPSSFLDLPPQLATLPHTPSKLISGWRFSSLDCLSVCLSAILICGASREAVAIADSVGGKQAAILVACLSACAGGSGAVRTVCGPMIRQLEVLAKEFARLHREVALEEDEVDVWFDDEL
eukprot:GDKJ01011987.1.p1 GENE.GDKJ01011987.1~~GDKJ01011987.1.p1  ORF type:complete len:765 (+),score=194.62 GDKJ01011987.1:172-2466(+)